jgi:WD40 repeat protein
MMAVASQVCGREQEVFDRVIVSLYDYPNLFALLCMLAIRLGDECISVLAKSLDGFRKHRRALMSLYPTKIWFTFPIILALHSDRDAKIEICSFIAAVIAEHPGKFRKLVQGIFCFMMFIRSTTGFADAELQAVFLSSIHTVVCIEKPDIIIDILDQVFAISFFRPNHRLHGHALLQLWTESPFSEPITFELPEQSGQKPENLEFVENLIRFDKVFCMRFAYPLNDQLQWIDRPIATASLMIFQQLDLSPEFQQMAYILGYFCDRTPTENFNEIAVMGATEGLLGPFQTTYQEQFRSNFSRLVNIISAAFAKRFEILSNPLSIVPEASASMLIAERAAYGQFVDDKPAKQDELETDPILCLNFCPKLREAAVRNQSSSLLADLGEPMYEWSGNLFSLKYGATPISMQLWKDYIVLTLPTRTQTISNCEVSGIYPRKTGIEIMRISGKSYLVDLGTNPKRANKGLRKASFPNCANFPDSDLSRRLDEKVQKLSSFAYILELNSAAGRSFKDSSNYPIFPAILTDFDSKILRTGFSGGDQTVELGKPIRECFRKEAVPADFYFKTESIDSIPKWATSAADFVDQLRHMLESAQFGNALDTWTSLYFGKSAREPDRRVRTAKSVVFGIRQYRCADMDFLIVALAPMEQPRKMLALLSDGTVGTIDFRLEGEFKSQFSRKYKLTDFGETISSGLGRIAAFSNRSKQLVIIDENKSSTTSLFIENDVICCVGEILLFLSNDCSVSVLNGTVLCRTYSRITNMVASWVFKVLVVTTIDGCLHVFDLLTGHLIRGIDLVQDPKMLMISPKWGYILALSDNLLSIFNVNGLLIKQEQINVNIAKWAAFSSARDFDYVIFETVQRKLGFFSVFHPERAAEFFEVREQLAAEFFDSRSGSFVLFARTGVVTVLQARYYFTRDRSTIRCSIRG